MVVEELKSLNSEVDTLEDVDEILTDDRLEVAVNFTDVKVVDDVLLVLLDVAVELL